MTKYTLEEIRKRDAVALEATRISDPDGIAYRMAKAEIDVVDLLWQRFPDDGPAIMIVLDCLPGRIYNRVTTLDMIRSSKAELFRSFGEMCLDTAARIDAKRTEGDFFMTARVMIGGNARDGFTALVHDGDRVTAHEIAAPNADEATNQALVLHERAVADGLAPASLAERLASLEAWVAGVAHTFGTVWLPAELGRIDGMVQPVVVAPDERGRLAKAAGTPRDVPAGASRFWAAGYDAPVLPPLDLGRKARADGRDGTPPAGLSDADARLWRSGYDEDAAETPEAAGRLAKLTGKMRVAPSGLAETHAAEWFKGYDADPSVRKTDTPAPTPGAVIHASSRDGFNARVNHQTRTPPGGLSAADQAEWLAGWDNADQGHRTAAHAGDTDAADDRAPIATGYAVVHPAA